jgi:ATP-dependent DNA helicase 2 subunit 2
LNDKNKGEYEGISILHPLAPSNIDMLKTVDTLDCKTIGGKNTDLVDAIIVATDMLVERCGTKKFTKRIFIVTDAGGSQIDDEGVNLIMKPIIQRQIKIDVIGIEFEHVQETDNDGDTDMKDVNIIVDKKDLTPKQTNEKYLHQICEKTGGVVIPTEQAISMLNPFRSKKITMRPTKFLLELGQDIKIPIFMYKKTEEVKAPSAKKLSKIAANAANEDGTMKVNTERTYYSIDNPDEEVDKDQRVKSYRYGRNFVPISDVDEQAMKYKSDKCLTILGFSDQSAVPRHHFMGPTYCITSKDCDVEAQRALSTLIRACAQLDQVAIVRYCYRENTQVHLGFLYPQTKPDYDCFYYSTLPYTEDLRPYSFKSLTTSQHSPEQLQAAEDLIKSMDLMDAEEDKQGNKSEALKPSQTYSPALQHFFNCMHHRILYPNDPLPELDPVVSKYCYPERSDTSFYAKLIEKSQPALSNFAEKFPLKRVEKTVLGKRKYWFATGEESEISLDSYNQPSVVTNPVEVDETIAQQVKRLKPDDDPIGNPIYQNLFNDKADDVGTTEPVKDFNEMFSRRDMDLVDKAITQMQSVIQKLIRESIEDQYYQKCYDCLVSLRSGCIKEEESEKFNTFLQDLKKQYSNKNNRRYNFWKDYIVDKNLTLISSEEADDIDNVTVQEAKDFLHKEYIPSQEQQSEDLPKMSGEEEDLFGDLE